MPVYDHETERSLDPAGYEPGPADTAAFRAFAESDLPEVNEAAFAARTLAGLMFFAVLAWAGVYGMFLIMRALYRMVAGA